MASIPPVESLREVRELSRDSNRLKSVNDCNFDLKCLEKLGRHGMQPHMIPTFSSTPLNMMSWIVASVFRPRDTYAVI